MSFADILDKALETPEEEETAGLLKPWTQAEKFSASEKELVERFVVETNLLSEGNSLDFASFKKWVSAQNTEDMF